MTLRRLTRENVFKNYPNLDLYFHHLAPDRDRWPDHYRWQRFWLDGSSQNNHQGNVQIGFGNKQCLLPASLLLVSYTADLRSGPAYMMLDSWTRPEKPVTVTVRLDKGLCPSG